MMILEIAVEAVAAQVMTTQLGDTKFILDIQWNDRGQYYTMSISDRITSELIAGGLPLLLGVDLLGSYNLNIGTFIVVDTSGLGVETTIEEFGSRVKLYWVSEDENAV